MIELNKNKDKALDETGVSVAFSPMMILTKLITLHFYVGDYTIPFL